jgi:hypothetical protein
MGRIQGGSRGRYTRYFKFSRVSPEEIDYDLLVQVCKNINAALFYVTVNERGKPKLIGYFVLRGPRTYADDLARIFPNFLITAMQASEDLNEEEFETNALPFEDLKRVLFR